MIISLLKVTTIQPNGQSQLVGIKTHHASCCDAAKPVVPLPHFLFHLPVSLTSRKETMVTQEEHIRCSVFLTVK